MIENLFSWIVVLVILLASGIMITNRDWRIQLGMLAIQYLAAFWLVTRHLPFAMGSAKLVTGWMVVAALGMTRLSLTTSLEEENPSLPQREWFPLVLIGIVTLVAVGASPAIEAATPGLGLQVIAGSLILMGVGFIHLGITTNIFRVILGLLTVLIGFEIIYAAVEGSILVAGFLALTNLGLGLTGSYLLIAESSSQTQELIEEDLS